VAELSYRLAPDEYRFAFSQKTADPDVRGWLRITDRTPDQVSAVTQDGKPHPWQAHPERGITVHDVGPSSTISVRFKMGQESGLR
jgi:hypothetical protein